MADPKSPKNHRPLLVLIKIILAAIGAVISLSLCGSSEETSNLLPLYEFGFDQSAEVLLDGLIEIFK